jgi:hypothetical protein
MGVQKVPESGSKPNLQSCVAQERMTRVHARVLGRPMRSDGDIWISQGNNPVLRRHADYHEYARFRTSDLFIKASNARDQTEQSNGPDLIQRSDGFCTIWVLKGVRWVFFFLTKNNNTHELGQI